MVMFLRSPARPLCRPALLALVLLLVVAAAPARASNSGCRTDPLVLLSDGTQISMTTTIATDRAAVRAVHYTLHAPAGLQLVTVLFTPDLVGETFQYAADAAPGQFKTETLVETRVAGVAVTATTVVNGPIGLGVPLSGTAVGLNDQPLWVSLSR